LIVVYTVTAVATVECFSTPLTRRKIAVASN